MRSRAHVKGHPLHPILIAFPVAFTTGALLFDVIGVLGGLPGAWTTGGYLSVAAVLSGLAAGVPGFIDYLYAVPPNSSAKKRATYHMAVNLVGLGLFALGWAFRDWATLEPATGTLLAEAAGLLLIGVGGWLGGTLVYRNQIGVDHRYANAGKWKEQDVDARPGETVVVGREGELEVGQMKLLRLEDRRLVLARTEDGYVVFDDHCTHRGGSLAGGVLACGTVTCPWHGSQFDVKTGLVQAGPAELAIRTLPVTVSGGELRLTLPS